MPITVDITLRRLKYSALSWTEADANFEAIAGAINTLSASNDALIASGLGAVSRAAVKSLSPVIVASVYLREAHREGVFRWTAGNFAAHVAADTNEGIYIQSDLVPASSGCWVRVTPGDGEWHADWFGVPNDPASGLGGGTEVAAHSQLTALINLGNLVKPSKITFGSKIYTLGAALPEFSWQVILEGSRGFQSTIIVKRYVEVSATRGVLAFNDFGFTIRDMGLRAGSGSGGSGVSAKLTTNAPAAGRSYLVGCTVSVGDFCNHGVYVDGSSNTSGSPSYRGLWMIGGEYFGAAVSAVTLNSVQHWMAPGCFIAASGGSGLYALKVDGTVGSPCDDFQFHGVLAGRVSLDRLSRFNFSSTQIDNIDVGANCTKGTWFGHRWAGVVTNSAAPGEFVHSYDGMVVASGGNSAAGWRKWGSGRIQQWGGVTILSGGVLSGTAWPLAFTSSNINAQGNVQDDQGANIHASAQVIPTPGNTNFTVKAFAFNVSTGAYGGINAVVRWSADGE